MALLKGYKYTTENEAKAAQKSCNDYYGIPKNETDITKNWVNYEFAELNSPQFWYIVYDESIEIVLGQPINFEVIEPFPPIK